MERDSPLTGSLRALLLFDVAEEIDLPRLRTILGASPGRREPAFRHPAPEYVRFERPPVSEQLGSRPTPTGEQLEARIRYFDYGVASVELQKPFCGPWPELVAAAHGWISWPELEMCAVSLLKDCLTRTQAALVKPHDNWISEDYYVVQLDPVPDGADVVTAAPGARLRDSADCAR